MNAVTEFNQDEKFARCVKISKAIGWDIDNDVIRGRVLEKDKKFLPDALSLINDMPELTDEEKMLVSQIQGRTYANVFGLVERFINSKVLDLTSNHALSDQVALEGLVRFSNEEIKHQELFRRVDRMCGEVMPEGYSFDWNPDEVARTVLGKSTWAVLALTLHIELFTQAHYRQSIDGDETLSDVYRDVFKYHWMEESQHAIMGEIELRRVQNSISIDELDTSVDEFIELVCAVDDILNAQAKADATYFFKAANKRMTPDEHDAMYQGFFKAYRWQYIHSGAQHPHFQKVLSDLLTKTKLNRISDSLEMLH